MINVSIIILNYNYAQYVREAVDSALSQTYANCEVIVVDDGSTDHSKDVLKEYEGQIRDIYQQNQGMMGASNTGFNASSGDLILFLDADDKLFSEAISEAIKLYTPETSLIHWRLRKLDRAGKETETDPSERYQLSSGDLRQQILDSYYYVSVPTSGNLYSRKSLAKHFPLPEISLPDEIGYKARIPTDSYLKMLVPFDGIVQAIQHPLSYYRVHGQNNGISFSSTSSSSKRKRLLYLLARDLIFFETESKKINMHFKKSNLVKDYNKFKSCIISYKLNEGEDIFLPKSALAKVIFVLSIFCINIKYGFKLCLYFMVTNILLIMTPSSYTLKILNLLYSFEQRIRNV